ncbi:putative LysM domain-containing protein [Helianthus annuus]|nr:putative LysM domain-containing protein [Helianthus annuus]
MGLMELGLLPLLLDGDSVELLASRFGVSMDSVESVNGIGDPDNITVGALYYIPLNSG